MMKSKIKRLILSLLLWGLFCIMLAVGFINADKIRSYPAVSLRFDSQISGQAAYAAKLYSIEQEGDDIFWPTFWRADVAELESELVKMNAGYIAFSGDANLVWPAEYLRGTAPSVVDGDGCAVSDALAWRLWGSLDVIGITLTVDGTKRIVRGVFESERELLLLAFQDEDQSQGFSAAELSGGPANAIRSDAEVYAVAAGLGRPSTVIMGSGFIIFSGLLAALPLFIPFVYGLVLFFGFFRKRLLVWRKWLFFAILFIFALLLPTLLELLPAWLIPTRFSDFSFWSSLIQRGLSSINEFISISPSFRDVDLSMLLLKQVGIAFVSVVLALIICFRWQIHNVKERLSS